MLPLIEPYSTAAQRPCAFRRGHRCRPNKSPEPLQAVAGQGFGSEKVMTPELSAQGRKSQAARRHGGCAVLPYASIQSRPAGLRFSRPDPSALKIVASPPAAAGSRAILSSGTYKVLTDCPDGRQLLDERTLSLGAWQKSYVSRPSIWQKSCKVCKLTNRLLSQV